ncbi:MAG: TlpA disulfide reductase family protein [Candidatus Margulisiibacteriota bacterium]
MLRKAMIFLTILLLCTAVFAKPALNVGSPPPGFSLPNLSGKNISLENHLGRDVVILSFFASWSKSCQQEICFLQELAKQYKQKNLQIIGISYDRKLDTLKKYVEKNDFELEILHDKKLQTLKDFRILIIPTLLVIEQSGDIRSIYVDFDENVKEAVSQDIQKLLSPPEK